MEDPKNDINTNKNNDQNEARQISFSEYFYNNINLLPDLQESYEKTKKFIVFIITQMKKALGQKKEQKSLFLLEKIFDFMIKYSEKLGIPFFYLLVKENEFNNIIMNLFFDNIYAEKIKELIRKIIDIFNIDYKQREIDNPLILFYTDCINYGIITQDDLKEDEKRESLSEEEILFLDVESAIILWKNFRQAHLENDAIEFLERLLSEGEEQIPKVIVDEKISKSNLEFYQERIKQIKNYKNSKKPKKKSKEIKKEITYEIDFFDESDDDDEEGLDKVEEKKEEEDEILTQSQIKDDIRELRKKPLKDRTYFYKDEYIKDDEDEYIEYKNFYFPLGKEQEKELMRQFCAFLNTNGGRLYIGIHDDKTIRGVVINQPLKNYESKIFKMVKNFQPVIKPEDYFKFYAIPIKNNKNGRIINNLYVFKIIIKKGDPTQLYYVFDLGLNISTRQAGQCPNLKASEIHEKIIERKNIKNLQQNKIIENDDFDMNDPEPLINQKNKEKEKQIWNLPKLYEKNEINKNNNYNINNINNNVNNDNNYDNTMFEIKKNKKKKKKNTNKPIRVGISNIDKDTDEKVMLEFFQGFNYKDYKIFQTQDGIRNGYIDFHNEKDANQFIEVCNGMTFGTKSISLKIEEFY